MLSLILPIWLKPAWYERNYPISYDLILDRFGSLGEKVSGVLIFFPPPDRAHSSSIDPTKGFLPASSLINASCCLLRLPAATGRFLFFFHFFHHTAKPTDLVTSLPFRYLADCVGVWVGG